MSEYPRHQNYYIGESLNGGLTNGGLRYLSTIVHDCLQLSSFCDESSALERGPKRPQNCTIVDDCAQIADSGLKPPFESPHLDFPNTCNYFCFRGLIF